MKEDQPQKYRDAHTGQQISEEGISPTRGAHSTRVTAPAQNAKSADQTCNKTENSNTIASTVRRPTIKEPSL